MTVLSKSEKIMKQTAHFGANNYHPLPIVISEAEGAWVKDPEGNRYMDMLSAYSAVNQGHRHPKIIQALKDQADKITLTSRAFHNDQLGPFYEKVASLTGKDMVLPMNTGAEAVESAVKAARRWAYDVKGVPDNKAEIIACVGNFHGRTMLAVSLSSEEEYKRGFGPMLPGIKLIPYGDLEALKQAITPNTAAFLIEPIQGEGGVLPADPAFLRGLRELCDKHQALLIFDEVMTGFRVDYNCAQGYFGVTPDLTCLGKVIGGGLPVGAYGGKAEIMEQIAPSGPIYQAGTLSGNPLAMTAGLETLKQLTPESYKNFIKKGDRLEEGISKAAEAHGIPHTFNRAGSMIGFFFTNEPVINYETAKSSDLKLFASYYKGMANEGVFLPPSQFEGLFLSTAHTDEDIENTIQAAEKVFAEISRR